MNFATGLEGSIMFCRWLQQDIKVGDVIPAKRWLTWGHVTGCLGEYVGWYILMRLPIYEMKIPWSEEQNGPFAGIPRWHQRVLKFTERGHGGNGYWQVGDFMCGDS